MSLCQWLLKYYSWYQVIWIQAETNAILTMNSNMVTQNARYGVLTQVREGSDYFLEISILCLQ